MEQNEQVHSGKIRNALVQGTPYVTWGNLVGLALLVLSSTTGNFPGASDANASSVHENHSEQIVAAHSRIDRNDVRITQQESATAELYRADERHDRNLEAVQRRTDSQLQALNGKMDRLLEMMVQESRSSTSR